MRPDAWGLGGWGAGWGQAPEPPLQLHNNLRMIRNKWQSLAHGRPRRFCAACTYTSPRNRGWANSRARSASWSTAPAPCWARARPNMSASCCAARRCPACRCAKDAATGSGGSARARSFIGGATRARCGLQTRSIVAALRCPLNCKPDHCRSSLRRQWACDHHDDHRARGTGKAFRRRRVRAALGLPGRAAEAARPPAKTRHPYAGTGMEPLHLAYGLW
jgi:hypothetical protein